MKYLKFLTLIVFITLTSCAQTTKKSKHNSVKENTQTENKATITQTNATDFKTLIEKNKVQLIDVRTPNDYKDGHIEYAKNINLFDKNFISKTASLHKDQPVYVYCHSGGRSMKAANKLKKEGFNVINLTGGIQEWKGKNFEVKK